MRVVLFQVSSRRENLVKTIVLSPHEQLMTEIKTKKVKLKKVMKLSSFGHVKCPLQELLLRHQNVKTNAAF